MTPEQIHEHMLDRVKWEYRRTIVEALRHLSRRTDNAERVVDSVGFLAIALADLRQIEGAKKISELLVETQKEIKADLYDSMHRYDRGAPWPSRQTLIVRGALKVCAEHISGDLAHLHRSQDDLSKTLRNFR